MAIDYLQKILTAKVYDVAIESALDLAPTLSRRIGNRVLLKREDQQPVFSFKLRGAYNKMAQLSAAERARGVITASAGNHAQGVALAAQKLSCKATIVMPITTPSIKIQAVEARGAKVVLHGDTFSDAYAHALKLQKSQRATFVHPYDDPDVIAGQGTIAVEILRQWQAPIDAIFVAIGGGGLISGVASYVKRVRPEIKIIGVQPTDADAMARSIAAGRRIKLAHVGLFADSVAVREVGRETFRICRKLVDDIVLVDTDAICAALKDVFEDTRSILEPAGALSVAGLKLWCERHRFRDRTLVAIACGANMNFDRLRFVAEQAELGEEREAILAVTIPERPGSFRQFCALLGKRNVTEFNYRYADSKIAHLFVGIEVSDRHETAELLRAMHKRRIEAYDLSNNEMAKVHVRHLVGGHAPAAENEILYRFEFPERPGALMQFLNSMSRGWNISLFHYRNHGADYGRVLVGMQVPPSEKGAFHEFLGRLGYPSVEETANPAYRMFLGR
ncbi:MAG: threonine ammonia-lyase, biosynthetic [Betaproteobacteria bacterium]|nr:MAG: threonine ammonia-lyase, biosynthetic [Betaproteobacteria bacterium]TMH16666.1 MAG: threonine ammonia-lyase, biosynthetic [Betaproteobacteria bacterium]